MKKLRVGFGITGSFCTFSKMFAEMERLVGEGYDVLPIMSQAAYETDTRFGSAEEWIGRIEELTGRKIIHTVAGAEPIGPGGLIDVLLIEPCTGNTLAKLANGIADTAVTMAVKSHLRNNRPVVLAVSTNDGLGGAAKNIGQLLNYKNIYFVPMAQDDVIHKPRSLVATFEKTGEALRAALDGRQLMPLYDPAREPKN